jgi:hypothetical protein
MKMSDHLDSTLVEREETVETKDRLHTTIFDKPRVVMRLSGAPWACLCAMNCIPFRVSQEKASKDQYHECGNQTFRFR